MIRPLLIGLVTGLRSMTPLAVASAAAQQHLLPRHGAPGIIGTRLVAGGMAAMAVGEVLGDKWSKAPDRTVPAGLLARIITGGVAAAALAPPERRRQAALLGIVGAALASYAGLALRKRAMARHGQTPSGLVEDAIAIGSALLVVGTATRGRERAAG